VASSRHFVADHLTRWGVRDGDVAYSRLHDLLLIVSELVTNAVKYSPGDIDVDLSAHHSRIVVEVTDLSPEPAVRRTVESTEPGGRGLAMVEILASGWGQVQKDQRKTVWAQVSIDPGSVLASGCRLTER
jgi:two-component sensor histidine kinase